MFNVKGQSLRQYSKEWKFCKHSSMCLEFAYRLTSSYLLGVKVPLWGWTVEGEIQPAGRAAGDSQTPRRWSLYAAGYRRGWVSSKCWCRIYLRYEWRSHDRSSLWMRKKERHRLTVWKALQLWKNIYLLYLSFFFVSIPALLTLDIHTAYIRCCLGCF